MRDVFIYFLIDPRDNAVKYVGKTFRLNRRFRDHLNEKCNTKKTAWIKNLKKSGLLPEILKIEVTNEIECDFWERYWISQLKSWGFVLTNMTNGGDGSYGVEPWNKGVVGVFKHSEQSKKKMSDYRKKHTVGEENGFYGKTHSDENKKKWSEQRRGSKWNKKQWDKLGGKNNPNRKSVYCYDINRIFIKKYEAAIDAREDGFCPNLISKVCRGVNKIHKGYIFSFDSISK